MPSLISLKRLIDPGFMQRTLKNLSRGVAHDIEFYASHSFERNIEGRFQVIQRINRRARVLGHVAYVPKVSTLLAKTPALWVALTPRNTFMGYHASAADAVEQIMQRRGTKHQPA